MFFKRIQSFGVKEEPILSSQRPDWPSFEDFVAMAKTKFVVTI